MSTTQSTDEVQFGAEPRVDLLPPEVRLRKRERIILQRLGGVLVIVSLLVGAGIAASTWQAAEVQRELVLAQQRTVELLAAQAQYSGVQKMQSDLDGTKVAREFGASTEIDWKAYVAEIQSRLPADVGVSSYSLESASPLVIYEQPTVPLQGPRTATVRVVFAAPTVPSLPPWLEAMESLPGYADSYPPVITRVEGGTYTVDWLLHINEDALTQRFALPEGQ
ncbi:hypothetical protein [Cryobacterium sp. CG_9.6]|uniref:hypothetical protein n=1 Tax=Cryobacterium sp. CG_9.6 TaxID=2760710 RepID=UPI0024755E0E|nr:hypothetical protein [Cryobacterium sp. CG_9.6]MDH6238048.1 hypothetical protein [Cryobacterium sp. CG_9.6]